MKIAQKTKRVTNKAIALYLRDRGITYDTVTDADINFAYVEMRDPQLHDIQSFSLPQMRLDKISEALKEVERE